MRRFSATVAILIAFAGCSGGSDFPSFGAPTSTTALGTGEGAPSASSSTVRPGTGNAFCEFLRTYNDRFGRFSAGLSNPQQLRVVLNEAVAAVKQAEGSAPAEIKADVATVSRGFEALVRSLEQVGFDLTRLQLDTITVLQSPDFLAASQRMNAYVRDNCL